MRLRKLHYWVGIIMAFWLLNAAFTGMMRANASALYWKNRTSSETLRPLSLPKVSLEELYKIVKSETREEVLSINHLELRILHGESVYLVKQGLAEKTAYTLVHADSGKVLNPLMAETAKAIARTYVPEETKINNFEIVENHLARKAKHSRPAYRVTFDDSRKTEIFIDRDTGKVLTLLDEGRRFGLWMVKLHELDFAGLRRPASTVVGLGTIFVAITGLILAFRLALGLKRKGKK